MRLLREGGAITSSSYFIIRRTAVKIILDSEIGDSEFGLQAVIIKIGFRWECFPLKCCILHCKC